MSSLNDYSLVHRHCCSQWARSLSLYLSRYLSRSLNYNGIINIISTFDDHAHSYVHILSLACPTFTLIRQSRTNKRVQWVYFKWILHVFYCVTPKEVKFWAFSHWCIMCGIYVLLFYSLDFFSSLLLLLLLSVLNVRTTCSWLLVFGLWVKYVNISHHLN